MEGEYIVLSKAQEEWVRKVIKHMIKLTSYYSLKKQPLKDVDYENILGAFSDYTKKSRGNKMIIKCSVAFVGYLEEIEKSRGSESGMSQEQMQKLSDTIDDLFSLAETGSELTMEDRHQRIDLCGGELKECVLLAEMKDIFKDYISFCAELSTEKIKQNNIGVGTQQVRGR